MGFSKKGSRKIIVNGNNYIWRMSQKRPYWSEVGGSPMFIAIQLESHRSSKLVVNTNMAPPQNISFCEDTRSIFRPITPKDIKEIILKALHKGWRANEIGKPFEIEIRL